MLKKKWKGFSWIEIGCALFIASLVIMLTLPSFSRFQCLATQSEAKFESKRLLAAAELYKAELGKFPTLQELLDADRVKLRQRYYSYKLISSENGESLQVLAMGKPDTMVKNDIWQVDDAKRLENTMDSCKSTN